MDRSQSSQPSPPSPPPLHRDDLPSMDLAQMLSSALGGGAAGGARTLGPARKRPGLPARARGPFARAKGLPARSQGLPARGTRRHLEVAAADTVTMTREAEWWIARDHPDHVQRFVDQWHGARDLDCLDLYGASGRVGSTWQAMGLTARSYDIKAITVR